MKTTALDLYDTTGKVISKVDIPAALKVKIDPQLIALAIRVYRANQRQATSKVKTRGEVNRTTKKVWKQKGTGRARHGSRGAPIFVGGGVAHGPSGNQEYGLRLPKKMRQQALIAAIAQSILDNKVVIVDGLDKIEANTKAVTNLIQNLKLNDVQLLCLLDQPLHNVVRGARNVEHLTVAQAKRTNVFEIMAAEKIMIHKPALAVLVDTFARSVAPKVTTKPVAQQAVKAE